MTTLFKEAFPFKYQIFDNDLQNVLYMEDIPGQVATVSIHNTSAEVLHFKELKNKDDFHFALSFRKGTLDPSLIETNPIKTDEDGKLKLTAVKFEKDADKLFFQMKDKGATLASREHIRFNIYNLLIDATQGARGTRILFESNNIIIGSSEVPIGTTNEISISIVNHRGKKNIPLDFSFSGKDTILNDGSPNELELYISNLAVFKENQSTVTFIRDKKDHDKSSKIILSFVGNATSEPWALGTEENFKDIAISCDTWEVIDNDSEARDREWKLVPKSTQHLHGRNQQRHHGDRNHIIINILNIRTMFEGGHTALNIRYENIPGYWDGQTQVIVKKQALQFYTSDNNVGIGTDTPIAALEVKGDIKTDSLVFESESGNVWTLAKDNNRINDEATNARDVYLSEKWNIIISKYYERVDFISWQSGKTLSVSMDQAGMLGGEFEHFGSRFILYKFVSKFTGVPNSYYKFLDGEISNNGVAMNKAREMIVDGVLREAMDGDNFAVWESGKSVKVYKFSKNTYGTITSDPGFNTDRHGVLFVYGNWLFLADGYNVHVYEYKDDQWQRNTDLGSVQSNVDQILANNEVLIMRSAYYKTITIYKYENGHWNSLSKQSIAYNTDKFICCLSGNQLYVCHNQKIDQYDMSSQTPNAIIDSIDLSNYLKGQTEYFPEKLIVTDKVMAVTYKHPGNNHIFILKFNKAQAEISVNDKNSVCINSPAAVEPPLTIRANKNGQFLRLQLEDNSYWDFSIDGYSKQLVITTDQGDRYGLKPI